MKRKFEKVKNSFSDDEQKKLIGKLEEWSKTFPYGQRVTRNIYRESFLPDTCFECLFEKILEKYAEPIKKLEAGYRIECFRHTLMGDIISFVIKPSVFGCAVESKAFELVLFKNPNFKPLLPTMKDVKEFISFLKSGKDLKKSRYASLGKMKLKPFSVWSTWDDDNPLSDPFSYANTNDADEIRANMGLTKIGKSRELLLFTYMVPDSTKIRKATIADAGLYQYFEPPLETQKYGYTINWHDEPRFKKKKYSLKARPECIHDSVLLENLILPINYKT